MIARVIILKAALSLCAVKGAKPCGRPKWSTMSRCKPQLPEDAEGEFSGYHESDAPWSRNSNRAFPNLKEWIDKIVLSPKIKSTYKSSATKQTKLRDIIRAKIRRKIPKFPTEQPKISEIAYTKRKYKQEHGTYPECYQTLLDATIEALNNEDNYRPQTNGFSAPVVWGLVWKRFEDEEYEMENRKIELEGLGSRQQRRNARPQTKQSPPVEWVAPIHQVPCSTDQSPFQRIKSKLRATASEFKPGATMTRAQTPEPETKSTQKSSPGPCKHDVDWADECRSSAGSFDWENEKPLTR